MTNEQLEKQTERNRKRVMRLVAIERKASALSERLAAAKREWNDLHAQVRDTDEFEEYCTNHGIALDYHFGDVLA
jgi:hypothetical protein